MDPDHAGKGRNQLAAKAQWQFLLVTTDHFFSHWPLRLGLRGSPELLLLASGSTDMQALALRAQRNRIFFHAVFFFECDRDVQVLSNFLDLEIQTQTACGSKNSMFSVDGDRWSYMI